MPSLDQTVELPYADLVLIRAALNAGYYHATSLDLCEQYRKLATRPQSSNLTKSFEHALTLLSAYIEEATAKESDAE